jgi:hypothetical protein
MDEGKLGRDLGHLMGLLRYSPDIAPLDFWFFGWSEREMKKTSRAKRQSEHFPGNMGKNGSQPTFQPV